MEIGDARDITSKMGSSLIALSWLLPHKIDRNYILDKGVRYLSEAIWENLKILSMSNIQQM